MALVSTNLGEREMLDKLLKDALSVDENLELKLFRNDYTPISTSVSADFTPATFTGYVVKTLTRAGWNAATTVNNKGKSAYGTQQSWTCGATGGTVYGYWIEAATSNIVLWAERFGTTRILSDGDILNLTPAVTLNQE